MIHFSQPYWILAGLALCAVVLLFFRLQERQRQARMERFAAASLLGHLTRNVSARQRVWKKGLWLASLFCCFLALARPQYGFRMIDVKRRGIDILFALDTSKSMLTKDIRPNRLERAKLAIMDFVGQLEGDRVGLLPFAGSAFLVCPLTIDYTAFEESLTAVNTSIIPRGGTDLAAAIVEAEAVLGGNANHKILVLLTDGENLEGDAQAAAVQAGKSGMTIFTVGVGTTEGELIPAEQGGAGHFVKDESGKLITSKLDETALAAIAGAAGGMYAPLGKNGEGLEQIYQQKLVLLPKKELMEKQHKEPLERFSWPLGAAFLLLAAELAISGRKAERFLHFPFIKTVGRRIRKGLNRTAPLVVLCMLAWSASGHASQGEKAFVRGEYLKAADAFAQALAKDPEDARRHYNTGTAAYKNNLFDEAAASFQQALKSEDLGLQEKSYYNLGNALFKRGEELADSDSAQAEKLWQQARDAYDASLQLNPGAGDARDNRDLVARRLEELQQKQREQKQQQKDAGQQQGQGQNQEQQGQQGESQEPADQQGRSDDRNGSDQQTAKEDATPEKESQEPASEANHPGNQAPEPKAQPPEQPAVGDQQSTPEKEARQAAAEEKSDHQNTAAEAQPLQQGRMSPEEARLLLNRLKDEEGRLNFVPQASGEGKKEGTWKDW